MPSTPRAGASPASIQAAVPWQCHHPIPPPLSQQEHPALKEQPAPSQLPHPHQAARFVTSGLTLAEQLLDMVAFGRGTEQSHAGSLQAVGKGRQGSVPSDARGYHQGLCALSVNGVAPGCLDKAVLCRTRQGGVCGIWPSGVHSAGVGVEVTQWKAASRSVPCPYLQLFQL